MSTYYEYREVKVMIAHKLMTLDGWKVYGYSPDNSDPMTDYYDPAYWGGVAEKNGYILCVDVYGAAEPYEVKRYTGNFKANAATREKIKKLEAMTITRGASEQEEETAKQAIQSLLEKSEQTENKYEVVEVIPGHLENPPRCNWHIEKDGNIIAKGNGILKYASVDSYFNYDGYKKDLQKFRSMTREEYVNDYVQDNMHRWNDSEERSIECANSHYETLIKDTKLVDDFNKFVNKLDTTCGALLGEGDLETYKKVIVTEYKKEIKAFETENGGIKDGQCFIVKTSFNYGHNKGYVYRIHATEYDGKTLYHAYKLNGKLTKECTGNANTSNYWHISDNFIRWFEKGSLAWCELKEVETPYQVEKVVKKTIKVENKPAKKETAAENTTETTETNNISSLTYEVLEDTDTRTNEKIYLVKVADKLSKEDYIQVNKYIKSLGGYYSKFKHAFLFKEDPTEVLNINITDNFTDVAEETEQKATETPIQEETKKLNYNIVEDIHTKTNQKLWLVKLEDEIQKDEFTQVKRKFATLQGFYSSFKQAFIFKYDPTEKLKDVV